MPSTYSINVGTDTEAIRLATIEDVLNLLPDNVDKLVNPYDVRSVVYSVWENAVFKQLIGDASIEYIGLDRDDIFNKIYFGKKQLSGTDIMSSSLLSSDVDTFLFNTKSDSNLSNQSTKISILSGANLTFYNKAPYIKSKIAISSTFSQIIQLEITNPSSGNIDVLTNNGRVYVNDIGLPDLYETAASASNNKILVYDSSSGNLNWVFNDYTTSSVGTPSATSSIFGSPVSVNGFSLELNDPRPVIQDTFNSIQTGAVFNNAPISEVLKRMLYSYIPPSCSISLSSYVGEKGHPPIIDITYIVTKETDSVLNIQFPSGNVIGFVSPAPINTPGTTTISSHVYGIAPLGGGFTSSYIFQVTDSGVSNNNIPTTVSSSATFKLIYPYFWGVSSTVVSNATQMNSVLATLTKSISDKSNNSPALVGDGYVYFLYPSSYGYLSSILDENLNDVAVSLVDYTAPGLTSPNFYWSNISYRVYRTVSLVSIPSSVNWQFNY